MDLLTCDSGRSAAVEEHPCPHCCGEGFLLLHDAPGRYDEHQECWMPEEECEPCPGCRGNGVTKLSPFTPTNPAPEHVLNAEDELPF